jgi:malonate transporter and related proteins
LLNALLAVSLLIALGAGLRASGFMPEPAWAPVDRLIYYVLFPSLLVVELASAELAGLPVLSMTATLFLAQLAMTLLAQAIRHFWRMSGPAYTSVLQCLVRWNTYVALALAPLLFGRTVLPLIALAVAVMVPVANVMSVAALARHGTAGRAGPAAFARAVATNPLIVACALGIAINLSGITLPAMLREPLTVLGRATLALGLLTVGAGLRPAVVVRQPAAILATTAAHLLLKPALAIGLGLLLGLGGAALSVVALACAVPTATSSYILAQLLGGDAALMAALVTTTTVAALLTLPLILALAESLG